MKTISDYLILCTEAQTKKALELGAPLETCDWRITDTSRYIELDNEKGWHIQIPTAEEMIGWLEEQRILIEIYYNSTYRHYNYCKKYGGRGNWGCALHDSYTKGFSSRKEATLAAIDAALEYLENLKR